eukprot:TRINITY_DN2823_c4_g1_i1.p1 TRINITY_DN2823_c4_g1~~TRINITY_DN2823_c4_g1_i1.p1  ORF type:complete len:3100 (+),score=589.73 TRINITY_DN2823_c4_g1_i1:37-9300(+)
MDIKPFPTLILERYRLTPDDPALYYGNEAETMTFKELINAALQVAEMIPNGARGALCVGKGKRWVIGCLACSLKGAPFTVVDLRLGEPQREHIWKTWDPKFLIYGSRSDVDADRHTTVPILEIDEICKTENPKLSIDHLPHITPSTPAFVDWTTGTSTGKPKGVIMNHLHLSNMLSFREKYYPMDDTDIIGVNMFPLWYWWMGMARGRPTCLIPDSSIIDSGLLITLIEKVGITRIDCFSPSLLRALSQDASIARIGGILRIAVLSGEPLPIDTLKLVHDKLPDTLILNLLSTTEAGDVCTFELTPQITSIISDRLPELQYAPVGLPLPTVSVRPIPYKDTGLKELGVSGSGVPEGTTYLGDPTASDSFGTYEGTPTWFTKDSLVTFDIDKLGGDLLRGCFRSTQYHGKAQIYGIAGRLNQTAKVRGFRIDLGAIQKHLKKIPEKIFRTEILDGVPLVANDCLIGFLKVNLDVTLESNPTASALAEHLKETDLPSSHYPTTLVFINRFPVTPTGKLDSRVLLTWYKTGVPVDAKVGIPQTRLISAPNGNNSELTSSRVRAAWVELLGDPAVSCPEQTSMYDIGAHSLTITRLSQILSLRVADLIELSTIEEQARFIDNGKKHASVPSIRSPASLNKKIAVVGIGVRWPTDNGHLLPCVWESLQTTSDLSTDVTPPQHMAGNPDYVARGILLPDEHITGFDPEFWSMSKQEAIITDPNQRVLLELCRESLADSGPPGEKSVGVYASGSSLPQYLTDVLQEDTMECRVDDPAKYWALEVGNDKDYCATRVSYLLDLHGPSQTIQTACSSGLSCVAAAVAALRSGECKKAVAASVSIQLPQDTGYLHQPGMVWSVDGRCRPYDSSGTGTLPSSAGVAFTLKPLDDAERDGDRIYAVVLGCGVANDGKRKHSYNSPSRSGQVDAITKCLHDAGVDPSTVSMIEGHGTGTAVGDPIEIAALLDTYGSRKTPLSLGSVKGHIGHANTAAGAAGLLKAILCLHHKALVPTANHSHPISEITHPLSIQTVLAPWTGHRRCGVSSFGVGGTNVHLICEGYDPVPAAPVETVGYPATFLISAKSRPAAVQSASEIASFAKSEPTAVLNIEKTLSERNAFKYRVSTSVGHHPVKSLSDKNVPTVLSFPGQGGLSNGLCEGLKNAKTLPLFKKYFKGVEEVAGIEICNPRNNAGTQVLLFAVGYSLAKVVAQVFGVRISAVVGHSLGEVTAATVAGVFTLKDAVKFVQARGHVIDELVKKNKGGMVSVMAGKDEIAPCLKGKNTLEIACLNSPSRSVISGSFDELETIEKDKPEWVPKRIPTDAAFHSSSVDPGIPYIRSVLQDLTLSPPKIPLYSTVTGLRITPDQATSVEYWSTHMRLPVNFTQAVASISQDFRPFVVLEAGPQLLTSCIKEAGDGVPVCPLMAKPLKSVPSQEEQVLWDGLSLAWQHGAGVDWKKALAAKHKAWKGTSEVPCTWVPPVPYAREKCWPESSAAMPHSKKQKTLLPRTEQPVHSHVYTHEYLTIPSPRQCPTSLWPCWYVQNAKHKAAEGVMPCRDIETVVKGVKKHGRLLMVWLGEEVEAEANLNVLKEVVEVVQHVVKEKALKEILLLVREGVGGSTLLGFFRSVAREVPNVKTRRVILKGQESRIDNAVHRVYTDEEVTLSEEGTWAASRLVRTPFKEKQTPLDVTGKTVLITGGSKGIGLSIAKWVRDAKGNPIALSRRPPAQKDQEHGVRYMQCDVMDKERTAKVVEEVTGEISYVFHCAGVVSDMTIGNVKQAGIRDAVGAKMHGVQNLVGAVARKSSKTVVFLTSSSSSVLGPPGQSIYSAANAFTDASAVHYIRNGLLVKAVQWGGWTVGMSEAFNINPLSGESFFTPSEAVRFFTRENLLSPLSPVVMFNKIVSWPAYTRALQLPFNLVKNIIPVRSEPVIGHPSESTHPGTYNCTTLWPTSMDPIEWHQAGVGYLTGHKISGAMVVPATMWLEMMVSAVDAVRQGEGDSVTLTGVRFRSTLEMTAAKGSHTSREVVTTVDTTLKNWRVMVSSQDFNNEGKMRVHAEAWVAHSPGVAPLINISNNNEDRKLLKPATLYEKMASAGFEYLGPFRAVTKIETCDDGKRLTAEVEAKVDNGSYCGYSPATIDACTQVASLIGGNGLPYRLESFTIIKKTKGSILSDTFTTTASTRSADGRLDLVIKGPDMVGYVTGFEVVTPLQDAPVVKQMVLAPFSVAKAVRNRSMNVAVVPFSQDVADCFPPTTTVHDRIPEGLLLDALVLLKDLQGDTVPLSSHVDYGTSVLSLACQSVLPPEWQTTYINNQAESFKHVAALAGLDSSLPDFLRITADGECEAPKVSPVEEGEGDTTAKEGYKVLVKGGAAGFETETVPVSPPAFDPNEVLIRTEMWALNFLDVLLASGVMSAARLGEVGGECCGTVVAVGESVTDFKVGDRAAGLPLKGGLGSHAVLPTHRCVKVPQGTSLEHASTISLAYGTAWLAVKWLAKVQPGDTVLIHAAAGGVGQACVRLVLKMGGIPLCTCSTSEKRQFLVETCGVDPKNIFNSRSYTAFHQGVMETTAGEGVDVVVNSLSDEALKTSISLLKPFGKFVELGKRDQQDHTNLDLNLFSMGQQYMSAHLDVLLLQPSLGSKLLKETWDYCLGNDLPALPSVTYPIESAVDALDFLNKGKHIGKVLIKPNVSAAAPSSETTKITSPLELRPIAEDIARIAQTCHVVVLTEVQAIPQATTPTVVVLIGPTVCASMWAAVARSVATNENLSFVMVCVEIEGVSGITLGKLVRRKLKWIVLEKQDEKPSEGVSKERAMEVLLKHVSGRLKLRHEEVDIDAGLASLGFDSLSQLQLAHAIRTELGLPNVELYDAATVRTVAKSISLKKRDDGDVLTIASRTERKCKILCLHGFRTNKQVLLSQVETLTKAGCELVFIDAPQIGKGPGDPDVPEEIDSYEWWSCPSKEQSGVRSFSDGWDGTDKEGLDESEQLLSLLASTHGPFDGVLGFSQGAAMASHILTASLASWGVLFSTIAPHTPPTPSPTLHVFDPNEPLGESCLATYHACQQLNQRNTKKIEHVGGHGIPQTGGLMENVAEWVRERCATE